MVKVGTMFKIKESVMTTVDGLMAKSVEVSRNLGGHVPFQASILTTRTKESFMKTLPI